MKIMKKALVALLVVLLCVGISMLSVFAAETAQDGLVVNLTTDQQSYDAEATIIATLTVENTNAFDIYDVSLESLIPAGYAPADGDATLKQLDVLAAGASVSLSVRYVPGQDSGNPETGSATRILNIWVLLLTLSAAGVIALAVKYPRLRKSMLCLVLCGATMLSLVAGVPIKANAAGQQKSVAVSADVTVAGETVRLQGVVDYTLAGDGEAEVFSVEFILDYEGAPQLPIQQVAYGACAAEPAEAVREGYTLGYWYTVEYGVMQIFDLFQPVTRDLTLYARWITAGSGSDINFSTFYAVSFGYPDGMTEEQRNGLYLPEEQLAYAGSLIYGLPEPVQEGYAFGAWCYDSALTQMAGAEDVINGDVTLYPLMVEDASMADGMATNNFVADLDVTDLNHSVTVKAPSYEAVEECLVWLDISGGGAVVEMQITDNGDGTYTVRAAQPLVGGRTYQLRVLDREKFPATGELVNVADSYIRFYHQGQLQSLDVCYYNIFTVREEVNNLRLANGLIFIHLDQVEGLDMESVSSMYAMRTDGSGQMQIDTNDQQGVFYYAGADALQPGDVVVIYEGDAAVLEEYQASKTVAAAENTAFLEIVSVDGQACTYRTPELSDVMFCPDVLPIPMQADTDGDEENNSVTIADSYLDYRYFPVESTVLDENTVAEVGDFIAFYSGTLENATDIRYAKITSVEHQDGNTVLGFEEAALEDIQSAMDTYLYQEAEVDLTPQEQALLENEIIQQGIDSEFAQQAAALAAQEKFGLAELPVWGKQYALTPEQAQTMGVDIESGEVDVGTFVYQLQIDPPDVHADIDLDLQRITTINNGQGLRVAFGIYIPVGIEIVNIFTGEVDQSLKMDLYITLEQEFAFDIRVSAHGEIDLVLGFIPVDFNFTLTATFEIGIYTGVGVVVMVDTEKNYEKSYLWDELVKNDGSNGAFTSAESLADQLNSMMSDGNSSFFNMYQDEDGNSTLVQEYSAMLQKEMDYIDILAIRLHKFKDKITPTTPVAEYCIEPELVFAAKVNVMLGTSFEAMNVKEYSFSLRLSAKNGVSAWANPVVDKQTPYHSFNLLLMGNLGLRAGIRVTASIGLLSVKLCNVGVMLEVGFYIDLYGFGYYHYDWDGETGKSNIQKAGAIFVEIGIYMDLDLFAGALMDLFTLNVHVLEMEIPIWELGTTTYACGVTVGEHNKVLAIRDKDANSHKHFTLDKSVYQVESINIVTGELSTYICEPKDFDIVIPAAHQNQITYQKYNHSGMLVQQLYMTPGKEAESVEVQIQVTLTASRNQSGSRLDSVYDVLGELSDTITIQWSRGKTAMDIRYCSGAPGYYYHDDFMTWHPANTPVVIREVMEDSPIPEMASINHLAPQVEGMDFAGWEVYCSGAEELNGMYIQEISELAGYTMPLSDITLYPLYTPREDTKYTVRHLVPSLTEEGEYEVFYEEVLEGTTHGRANVLDLILHNYAGVTIDYGLLPIQDVIYDNDGNVIFIQFGVTIRHDGSTEIELYYNRDSCNVTICANNPDYTLYGTEAYSITGSYVFGQTLVDPGYAETEIPGYTFLGWSTSADGSDGILETLPESLTFTEEQRSGLTYYAIWQPEQLEVEICYLLLDAEGFYQVQGVEKHTLDMGTTLTARNLAPTALVMPEAAFVQTIEAYDVTGNDQVQLTADHISPVSGQMVIHVYYSIPYSNIYINRVHSYVAYGETITLPDAEKQGYRHIGWQSVYEEDRLYAVNDSFQVNQSAYCFVPVFAAADDTVYTVEHYLEQEDGTYSDQPNDRQLLTGTTESWVRPETNSYLGFVTPATQLVQIAADGSTVVTYYYARETYSITVDYAIEGESLNLRGKHTLTYKYGVAFSFMDPLNNPLRIDRPGYQIVGWYLADETLNPDQTLLDETYYWVEGDALTSRQDLVFKPKWEKVAISYKVEHYTQQLDGSYILQRTESLTGYIGDTVTAVAAQLVGFTFDEENAGNILSGQIALDGSLVLKLYYTRNSYAAEWYDYDGQTLLGATWFMYGETVTAATFTPARMGYTFDGWSIGNVTMTTAGASFNAKDHGLWTANTYTVTFDANGGQGSMAEQSFAYDRAQTLNANAFTKDGYVFAGWSLTENGEVQYADQEQVSNLATSGSVTLYACWTAGQATAYQVEYYGENLAGDGYALLRTDAFTGNTESYVTATAIALEGFTYDSQHADNVTGGTIAGDGSLVLKLYYSRNSYTLTLDFNGESMKQAVLDTETYNNCLTGFNVADQTMTLKYGQTLSLENILAPVWVEESWYWDEDLQADVCIEGHYEEVPMEEAFPGYTFSGWTNLCETMPAEDLTLTAQWTPVQITVTLYSGYSASYAPGVTGEAVTFTCSYGDCLTLDASGFAYEGFVPAGWKFGTGSGGFGQYAEAPGNVFDVVYGYHSSEYFTEGTVLELFPYWIRQSDAMTVLFDNNGCEGTMPECTVDQGGGKLPGNRFTRQGYRFLGWSTDPEGQVEFVDQEWISADSVTLNEDNQVTLYPIWEEIAAAESANTVPAQALYCLLPGKNSLFAWCNTQKEE